MSSFDPYGGSIRPHITLRPLDTRTIDDITSELILESTIAFDAECTVISQGPNMAQVSIKMGQISFVITVSPFGYTLYDGSVVPDIHALFDRLHSVRKAITSS